MALTIWVAELHISHRTAEKVRHVHGIDPEDVRSAVECRPGLTFVEDVHPDWGWRALLKVTIRHQKTLVVLFPTEHADVWNLASAYRI